MYNKILIAALLIFGLCSIDSAGACDLFHQRVYVAQPVAYPYPVVIVQYPVTIYQPVFIETTRWIPVVENRIIYRY